MNIAPRLSTCRILPAPRALLTFPDRCFRHGNAQAVRLQSQLSSPPSPSAALHGIVGVHKPPGWSSAAVVATVKKRLLPAHAGRAERRLLRVGHGGTLDRPAEGVLVIGVGRGCKLLGGFLCGSKTYRVSAVLGFATTTYDAEGEVTHRAAADAATPTLQAVQQALAAFTGDILQRPPAYSAVKVAGKRAWQLARAGEQLVLEQRPVHVHSIQLLDWRERERDGALQREMELRVHSGGGFYVRTLIHDVGLMLGCYASVLSLVRERQGRFVVQPYVGLDAAADDVSVLQLSEATRDRLTAAMISADAPQPQQQTAGTEPVETYR